MPRWRSARGTASRLASTGPRPKAGIPGLHDAASFTPPTRPVSSRDAMARPVATISVVSTARRSASSACTSWARTCADAVTASHCGSTRSPPRGAQRRPRRCRRAAGQLPEVGIRAGVSEHPVRGAGSDAPLDARSCRCRRARFATSRVRPRVLSRERTAFVRAWIAQPGARAIATTGPGRMTGYGVCVVR